MTDCFALLDETRRPWLEAEPLKEKFLSLSAATHPDRVHNSPPAVRQAANAKYTELNSAFNTLREPKDRLRHLLELETGSRPKDLQELSPDLADLFLSVGQALREVDTFLHERSRVASPLLQVQFFERTQDWVERIGATRQIVMERQQTILERVKALDARWTRESDRAPLIPELEQCWRLLSFYARWLGQLQNAVVQLSV